MFLTRNSVNNEEKVQTKKCINLFTVGFLETLLD